MDQTIVTKNYFTDEGDTLVIGGRLIVEEGAEVEGLDGGGSAQLVYLGKTTNFVRGAGSQSLRKISDILYFASAAA